MKKYLMTAAAAIALCGTFTSCTHDDITVGNGKIDVVENYETAFISRFGQPAVDHTWGFGKAVAAGTRSASSPSVPDIVAPYSADWIASYNNTATEPTSANVANNDAGSGDEKMIVEPVVPQAQQQLIPNKIQYNGGKYDDGTYVSDADNAFYTNTFRPQLDSYNSFSYSTWSSYGNVKKFVDERNQRIQILLDLRDAIINSGRNLSDWLYINTEPVKGVYSTGDYVTNFKITGTWTGDINVVATEGLTDGVANGNERTVVVTGKWNLTADQRVGAKGRIIVADGGELAISEGKTLEMVNQSRLVVLQGGKITGKGNISVTNGTAEGNENYNGGEINIEGYFNNNFGKFYNYGKFKVHQYRAGGAGGASGFFNHGVVNIDNGGTGSYNYVSTNARIFNACQWYCAHDMRAYIIEMAPSSYMYIGGELQMSDGNDGTHDDPYVALAGGAYLQAGTLWNVNVNWYGTSEDAPGVVEFGQITHLDWTNETAGFFRGNLYVSIDDQTNPVSGVPGNTVCSQAFWNTPGKDLPYKDTEKGGADVTVPGDEDFVLGESGCAPGYEGTSTRSDVAPVKIIAEDLSVDEAGDFDFNDVVFLVEWVSETEAQITLQMAGGTLPLVVGVAAGQEENDGEFHANEVHKRFNVPTGTMVNIGDKGVVRDVVKFNVSGTFSMDNFAADCNNIRVAVKKSGEWHELTAVRGKVPSKIAVAKRYVPCSERDDIEETYPEFSKWVVNPSITWY